MHIETQTKTRKLSVFRNKSLFKMLGLAGLVTYLTACSFVELQRGAENIIFAQEGNGCELVKLFDAEVKTSTFFISRKPEAIAEELQVLAQNEAYKVYANAIWPNSDIDNGTQNFKILKCEAL